MIITEKMIAKAYELAKQVHNKKVIRKDALDTLESIGMNRNSASDYLHTYSCMTAGKIYTRATSTIGTEYYLHTIYSDKGQSGLITALLSLSQHLDYYEEKSGSKSWERREVYEKYLKIAQVHTEAVFPDEVDVPVKYNEGKAIQVWVNSYERNPVARKRCIEHHGTKCKVCDFDFQQKYGNLGAGFIHVHHKKELSAIGKEYSVDPVSDLIPVCPNCHAMLHKKKPAYLVEELKQLVNVSARPSPVTGNRQQ